MSRPFSPDLYVTCATVIPVVFLAVVVQGRTYSNLLKIIASRPKPDDRGFIAVVRMAVKALLVMFAFLILFGSLAGEILALRVLVDEKEQPGARLIVYSITISLMFVASGGSLISFYRMIWSDDYADQIAESPENGTESDVER
jgi:hypothetical protein